MGPKTGKYIEQSGLARQKTSSQLSIGISKQDCLTLKLRFILCGGEGAAKTQNQDEVSNRLDSV